MFFKAAVLSTKLSPCSKSLKNSYKGVQFDERLQLATALKTKLIYRSFSIVFSLVVEHLFFRKLPSRCFCSSAKRYTNLVICKTQQLKMREKKVRTTFSRGN